MKLSTHILTLSLSLSLVFVLSAWGQPDLSQKEFINGLAIYPDQQLKSKYYYAPKEFELASDLNGKPEFSFIRMTHIASKAAGIEEWKKKSVIQFTIRPVGISKNSLEGIKDKLKKRENNSSRIKLVPAPIKRMQAYLVYTNLDNDSTAVVRSNYQGNQADKGSGGLWTTKVFSIGVDKFTSQLLWDGFKKNKGLLSVAYGIWSRGTYGEEINYVFNGPMELEEVFHTLGDSSNDTTSVTKQEALINAGAFQLGIDLNQWPDLLEEVSFENKLSPRYGLVDVYCYDFNKNIRPDLFGKIVEFEAQGAGKGKVKTEIEFLKTQADIYTNTIKFEYAVRLDKPLLYRVIELFESGEVKEGPWKEQNNWTNLIDISSQVDFNSTFKSEEP